MEIMETEKPLWAMTRGEFLKMINKAIEDKISTLIEDKKEKGQIIRGNKALAKFLGCGLTKVQRLVNSGILDDAMTRNDRVIIYDTDKVLECLKYNNKNTWAK